MVALAQAVTASSILAGNATLCQNFDGPDTIWRVLSGRGRIVDQSCLADGARNRTGCECAVVVAPVAESTRLACPIEHVAVLEELEIRMWVKASRPDVQLAARVVLPRSVDKSGQLVTAIVRGASYDRPGHWRQLVLKNVPQRLADEVRILRVGPAAKADPRQAYIDAVVLVVPGEPGGVELVTDELEIDGVVLSNQRDVLLTSATVNAPPPAAGPALGTSPPAADHIPTLGGAPAANAAPVTLQGSVLMVNGKQFSPRAIQWQNESLAFLAERGFNIVWLPTPPTAELIAEATRHGLWFICVPPRPDALARAGVGQPGDRVIAWCLDDDALELDREYARRWASSIRERDAGGDRPLVFLPREAYVAANDHGEAAVVFHPRAARMQREDYDQWLAGQQQILRPGMPLWAGIATQFSNVVGDQANVLSDTLAPPPSVDATQIAMQVRLATAAGFRGFLFRSSSRLDDDIPVARQRAAVLELVNRRLQLLEPWLAGGHVAGRITSFDARWSGALLHVDRTRLVLPTTVGPTTGNGPTSAVSTPGELNAVNHETSCIVPGIPESSQAYWMTPATFRRLAVQRVAGGGRVVFPSRADGVLFLTEDYRVVEMFRQRIARDAASFARLQRDVAAQCIESSVVAARTAVQHDPSVGQALRAAEAAAAELRPCDALLAAGRPAEASDAAAAIHEQMLQALTRQRGTFTPGAELRSNPLAMSGDQLLANDRFTRALRTMRPGGNLLYGGDFEDQGQLKQFGWVHASRAAQDASSGVRLSATGPLHGKYSLELTSAAGRPASGAAEAAGRPRRWIVSPPIPVVEGQTIAITGWVRIDQPVTGSVDGLQIIDSLGGEELAVSVRQTSGWQAFEMVRGVPASGELRLTLALAGTGTAHIDGMMVRALETATLRRLPPATPAANSPPAVAPVGSAAAASSAGPLLGEPNAR